MTLHTTDYDLLDAVRQFHDPDKSVIFVELHQPACLRFCIKGGMQRADAEELTQQFCTELLDGLLNEFDRARGKFRPWLFARLRYAKADFYKRKNRAVPGAGQSGECSRLESEPEQFSEFEAIWNAEALRWALAKVYLEFGERDSEIFLRIELHDEETKAVAAKFCLATRTVRHIRDQVKKRLGQLLESVDCFG